MVIHVSFIQVLHIYIGRTNELCISYVYSRLNKAMEKINVAITWGNWQLVEPSYKSYDVAWLRETTLRQLLAHVVGLANTRISLNDAETITLYVVEHVDDVTSSGGKRKRTLGKTNATDLVDDLVYETMTDCSTREFLFHVVPVNVVDIESEVVNAFTA